MKKFLFFILATMSFAQDVIKVGISNDYPPFEYLKDDSVVGFDVDFAKLLFDKLGVKYELVDTPYDRACEDLNSGKIDMAISGFGDDEYTKNCSKSISYFDTINLFIKIDGSKFNTIDDLNNTKIGFFNDGGNFEKIIKEIPGAIPENKENVTNLMLALMQGKIDAILTDNINATALLNKDLSHFSENDQEKIKLLKNLGLDKKLVAFVKIPSNDAGTYVLFPKGAKEDLINQVNKIIEELKNSGEFKKLSEKYGIETN